VYSTVPDQAVMKHDACTENPRVSVIVPAYNTAHLIKDCLDSVLGQSFRDFELIVVNDGSPDTATLETVLQPYLGKIVYLREDNKRAAGARNTAIRRARGEFLAFVDSDDSWFPDHLACQMRLFEEDPELDMVYADALQLCDAKAKKTFMEDCPSQGPVSFDALVVERCQIPISTVVARKDAVVRAGMFDESLARCDDYDMWLRSSLHGAKIAYRRTVQARLNVGRADSLGQSRSKMMEAYWRILDKIGQTPQLSDSERTLVHNRAAEIRARYLLEEGKQQLLERHPERARELFAEANLNLRLPKLRVAIRGLEVAPQATSKLIFIWNRFRNAVPRKSS
jgi:glycosyltransferase involved in cell wall biosynthesis